VSGSNRPAKRPRILDHLETRPPRPLSTLAPKAQQLLTAAQRIVLRDGFSRLSFANVAEEAGVYQSAVRYYFGSKDGLIQALIDASTHDLSAEVYVGLRRESPLPERLGCLIEASRTLPKSEEYKSQWEILPHVLRDDELRAAVARLYDTYRSHTEELFDQRDDEAHRELAESYACLMLAVIEGMAIQRALDPEGVDVDRVFKLWASIVSRSVDEIVAEETG
jgi:AcrR family transcriptional regulator